MLLRQQGRRPGVATIIVITGLLLQISSIVHSSDEDDLCSLNEWYVQAVTDDAFSDPEPDVAAIETEVKSSLEKKGGTAQVKCSVLAGYDEIIYGTEEEGEEEGDMEGDAEGQEGDEDELEGLLEDEEENPPPKKEDSKVSGTDSSNDVKEESQGSEDKSSQKSEDKNSSGAETAGDDKSAKSKDSEKKESKTADQKDDSKKDEADLKVEVTQNVEENRDDKNEGAEQADDNGKEKTQQLLKEPDTQAPATPKVPSEEEEHKEDVKVKETAKDSTKVPIETTPKAETIQPFITNQDLLAERLLAEQLRADYSTKLKDLELQLLKMENKLVVDTADKDSSSNSVTKLENQLLKLENELLKINTSFTILQAENALLKAHMGVEKGQYPALTDKNATAVSSLVDSHQSRITELSDVITKQSGVIKALDKKSELLEGRNTELKETLVDQSDIIKTIIKRIEDLQKSQEKQNEEREKEKKRLYDLAASVEDARKQFESREADSGSRNLSAPDPIGGPMKKEEDENAESKTSDVELPLGNDKIKDETKEVKELKQNLPESPKTDDNIKAETLEHAKDKYKKESQQVQKEAVNAQEKPDGCSNGSCDKPKEAPKATEKAAGTKKVVKKKKKVVKKKKAGGVKKVVKKKKKVVKKGGNAAAAAAVEVPQPKYVDDAYPGMKDCYDHYQQGRKRDTPQRIKPVGSPRDSDVFCDMRNGGWTIIMRRQEASMDFYRGWSEYQRGFGGTYGDHFAGLELIHRVTNQGHYQLRVELTDWNRNSAFAIYDLFRVEGEEEGYRLHVSGYTGTAGDGFAGHSGMKFSTKDKDNDLAVSDFGGSCATRFHGAWWYNKCYKSNPTGKYYRGGKITEGKYDGLAWKPWTGSDVSLRRIEMKIRPKVDED